MQMNQLGLNECLIYTEIIFLNAEISELGKKQKKEQNQEQKMFLNTILQYHYNHPFYP